MGWEGFQAGNCKWWEAGEDLVRAAGEAPGQEGAPGLQVSIGHPISELGEEMPAACTVLSVGVPEPDRESTRDLLVRATFQSAMGEKSKSFSCLFSSLLKCFSLTGLVLCFCTYPLSAGPYPDPPSPQG